MTAATAALPNLGSSPSLPVLPPGPRFTPPIYFFLGTTDYLARCARRYGVPLTIPSPLGGRDVLLGSPESVKALYTADPDTFDVALVEATAPLIGPRSLILQSGAQHRHDRRLLTPPFHGERMRAYGQLMQDVALRSVAALTPGRPFSVLDITQAISLEVIIRAVFGVADAPRVARVRDAIVRFVGAFSPLIIFFPALRRDFAGLGPWAAFQRASAALDRLIYEEIDARRGQPPGEDILSLLLAARYDDGAALAREEIRDQLLTLLFAGHETTAVSLGWALYFLHRPANAAVLQRVLDELRPLGRDAAPEALAQLPLLGAVCHETLRLRPLLPVHPIRKLRRPFPVAGYTLQPGQHVTVSPSLLHRDPALFPEPDLFRPERFLERSYGPFEFLPFGGGSRRCLGAAFALYEMKIVLGTLLTRRTLRLTHPNREIREVRRNLTMGPLGGIPMVSDSA